MQSTTLEAIRAHAAREYPRECCGLVIVERGRERYVPCRNLAVSASEHVIVSPEDYALAEDRGEILSVIHSHPDYPATPSALDKTSCEASGLPWTIISWPSGDLHTFAPSGYQAPLLGRPFAHGVLDCYQLIVDWYWQYRGVALLQFTRRDDWWLSGGDLYMQHYAEAGFSPRPDDEFEIGDVIVMQIRSPVANHAGVYIGDGLMLHHLYGRLSSRDVYGGYWADNTRLVLRHTSQALAK